MSWHYFQFIFRFEEVACQVKLFDINQISPNKELHRTRVIYDRVRNKKNNFEITAFLNYEQGTSREGKF